MLNYIHKVIPSYLITLYVGCDDDECRYLNLFCKELQKSGNGTNQAFRLRISFCNPRGESYYKDPQFSQLIFSKNSEKSSSQGTLNGEIYCYIGAGIDPKTRLLKAQRHLLHRNNLITGIVLDLPIHSSAIILEAEIGLYIMDIGNNRRCQKLCIENGSFMDGLAVNECSKRSNCINQLEFRKCLLNQEVISLISAHHPSLDTLQFHKL